MWMPIQEISPLRNRDVHIWKLNLTELNAWPRFQSLLNKAELARANRFRFAVDRIRFVKSRAVLRILLAGYLKKDPKDLIFNYSKFGKPSIANGHRLTFNVSHSREMVLFGFCAGHQIGVDVEFHQVGIDLEDLATKFFSATEREGILSLPVSKQVSAFYNCWTRKEAFIKALGYGLSFPLDQFSVSVMPEATAQLLEANWGKCKVSDWTMKSYIVGTEYSAASIVNLSDPEISTFAVHSYLVNRGF